MSNKYNQSQTKIENKLNYVSKNYQNSQGNNFRHSYSSKSPSSNYGKIKYEKDDVNSNLNKPRYNQYQRNSNIGQDSGKKSPINNNNINKYKRFTEKTEVNKKPYQENSLQTSKENANHAIYFSEFTKIKNSIDPDNKYSKIPTYTLKHSSQRTMSEKYEINHNNKAGINRYNDNNLNKNRYNKVVKNFDYKERKVTTHINNKKYDKEKKNINEKKIKKEYANKSYQGNKYPPKYYRNNPLIRAQRDNNEIKNGTNHLKPVAQKICNIVIRGGNSNYDKKQYIYNTNENYESEISLKNMKNNKGNSSGYKYNRKNKQYEPKILHKIKNLKNKNIEYEDENDDEYNDYNDDYYNEEEEIEIEEYNMPNKPSMLIQRAQSIEQTRDKKRMPQISQKKRKIFKLKIEKLKNSNFELKKTETEPLIQIQKAQSFIQPSDFNYKIKNKKNKFEVSEIRDCGLELIGKTNFSVDKEDNILYDTPKKTFYQYQFKGKQNNNEVLPIPKPNNKDSNKNTKDSNNYVKNKKNENKNHYNKNYNTINNNTSSSNTIVNSRTHYIISSKKDSTQKKENDNSNKKDNKNIRKNFIKIRI